MRILTILCVLAGSLIVSGCELNNGTQALGGNKTSNTKNVSPSPKPMPKLAPVYPSAERVIALHANQCGGFTLPPTKRSFKGENELKAFFKFMCLKVSTDPNTVMTKLLKLDLAYFWPDDIKQYLWLQKQQITLQINAQKEQQALNNQMQKTLSSLADIEQQLLLREDIKEQ